MTNSAGMAQLHNPRHPCEREDLLPLHVAPARYPIGVGHDEVGGVGYDEVWGVGYDEAAG